MADDRWPDGTLRVPPSLGLEFQPFTSAFSAHVGYSVYASEKRDFEQLCVSKLGQKPGSVVKSIAGSMIHRLKSGTLHQVAVGTRRDCSVLDMDIRVLNQRGDELLILRDPEFRQENVVTVHLISGDLSQVFHAGYEDGAPFAKALVVATALEGVQLDLKPQMPQLPPKYADMKVRVICEGSSDFVQLSTAGSVRATTKVPVAYVKLKEVDAVVSYRWDAKKMRVWDPSGTSLAWEGVAATNALNQMIRDKRKI
ncbi:hypothetical protein AB1Y20_012183 [Prymnesium parvum]|uniref:Uncharacterized protein n=1 Tax=Prymnesium parvum TaxID=97485 RepID=A0AB34IRB3_PRYPA|mmetsp:Transcript_21994/g.54798  ORF Transcript_21994/g.54798 Transcript_21994/m.54798 type:complete len:254 (-) Transcript_21994:1017-1778(-)